jgi:hypothetical protein
MKSSRVLGRREYSARVRPLARVLVTALCALAAAGCGGDGSGERAVSQAPAPSEAEAPSGTSGRDRAPTIAGTSLDDELVSLADYRGQAVLVNVWFSW